MSKLTSFDVLIVYAEGLATSCYDKTNKSKKPFKGRNKSYNEVYGYFLETCEKIGLKAAFATSADIIGPGFCRSFWTYRAGEWIKFNTPCFSKLIFDKFSPKRIGTRARRQLLFSDNNIKPFNNPALYSLFFDKQKTYDGLSEYVIPTVSVGKNSMDNMYEACKKLEMLMGGYDCRDFSDEIVMKDKFGSGGSGIYKYKIDQQKEMYEMAKKHPQITYIIQPFAKFDKKDIRLIYLGGKIVQYYIRIAKKGDFRCNEHQGGVLTYLNKSEIPFEVVNMACRITKKLNNKCSLFTLDFIMSNSGRAYLLEGNTGPGLDWNTTLPQNEIEAKKLINLVVDELAIRAAV